MTETLKYLHANTAFQRLRKFTEKSTRDIRTLENLRIFCRLIKRAKTTNILILRRILWVIASQFVMQEGCGSAIWLYTFFGYFLLHIYYIYVFHSPAFYVIKLTHKPQALDRKDSNRLSVVGRLMSTHSYHLMAHFLLKHMDYSGIIKQK